VDFWGKITTSTAAGDKPRKERKPGKGGTKILNKGANTVPEMGVGNSGKNGTNVVSVTSKVAIGPIINNTIAGENEKGMGELDSN